MPRFRLLLIVAGLFLITGPATATILPGQTAPPWTKTELDAPAPAARSLSDYHGKVLVMFLLGYD